MAIFSVGILIHQLFRGKTRLEWIYKIIFQNLRIEFAVNFSQITGIHNE